MRPKAKVTIDSVGLYNKKSYYEESIGTKTNDLDICLDVV